MSVQQNLAIKFRDHVIEFLDELIEQFPQEADIIICRIFIKDQISPVYITESFADSLIKYQDIIKDRNEKFFLDNDNLFSYFEGGKVLHFKKIWQSDRLDDDDRETMWSWMDSFILLARKYDEAKKQNK